MNILSKDFKYTNSASTDIRKTFEKAGFVSRDVDTEINRLRNLRHELSLRAIRQHTISGHTMVMFHADEFDRMMKDSDASQA